MVIESGTAAELFKREGEKVAHGNVREGGPEGEEGERRRRGEGPRAIYSRSIFHFDAAARISPVAAAVVLTQKDYCRRIILGRAGCESEVVSTTVEKSKG
jgi:hypothetical protein